MKDNFYKKLCKFAKELDELYLQVRWLAIGESRSWTRAIIPRDTNKEKYPITFIPSDRRSYLIFTKEGVCGGDGCGDGNFYQTTINQTKLRRMSLEALINIAKIAREKMANP